MRNLAFVLICIVLLSACQPAPTAVPEPIVTETLADSPYLVQGVWYIPVFGGVIMGINAGPGGSSDMTYSVYSMEVSPWEYVDGGKAKFEDGKLTYLTSDGTCKDASEATYKIHLTKEDGFITGMKQKVVGSDSCSDRAMTGGNNFAFYAGIASMPQGTERPPTSGAELFGIWYEQDGLVLNYSGEVDLDTGNANIITTVYYVLADPWELVGTGTAKYENGILTFDSTTADGEEYPSASYEISMVVHGDKIIGFHPRLIGEDLYTGRKDTFDNKIIRRVKP